MAHRHDHGPANYGRAFAIGIALNLGFVLLEALYGYWSNSLALVADAGHNLSDVLALVLAWGASVLAQRPPSLTHTYGLRRTSILAALANAILLLVAVGGIAWEAIRRFAEPGPVAGETVIWVAGVGILINTATALMFMSGRKTDLNIRGAFLHMAADAGVSLGVVLAGIAILVTGWNWIDPVVSLVIVVVIVIGTWGLLHDSVTLALDGVPPGVDAVGIQTYLAALPGVTEVHDLHIWGMSTTEVALTAHLVMPEGVSSDSFLGCTTRDLHDLFGVEHATLQVERGHPDYPCPQAAANAI
jgi:cobalt-zinc-cadmium efflux system protein